MKDGFDPTGMREMMAEDAGEWHTCKCGEEREGHPSEDTVCLACNRRGCFAPDPESIPENEPALTHEQEYLNSDVWHDDRINRNEE